MSNCSKIVFEQFSRNLVLLLSVRTRPNDAASRQVHSFTLTLKKKKKCLKKQYSALNTFQWYSGARFCIHSAHAHSTSTGECVFFAFFCLNYWSSKIFQASYVPDRYVLCGDTRLFLDNKNRFDCCVSDLCAVNTYDARCLIFVNFTF